MSSLSVEGTKGVTHKWWVLLTVCGGMTMVLSDPSLVNICLPRLTEVFETEPSVILWLNAAFMMVGGGLMLIFGQMGDAFGRRKLFIAGFFLFIVGLILCSFSQSILQLILSRVVQALGNSIIVGLGAAVATAAFPDQERGKAMGIVAGSMALGMVISPPLGGFLLGVLGWRSIFYLRVPFAAILLVMSWIFLKEQKEPKMALKFDLTGAATLFGSLTCLLLFFNLGGRTSFISLPVLLLAVGAIILLALFIVVERRAEFPMIDPGLFKSRLFTTSNISLGIMTFTTGSQTLMLPFYLINGLGHSTLESGAMLATISVATILMSPLSGWLSDKGGSRILSIIGITLVCLSLFLTSTLGIESSPGDVLFRLAIFGVGVGIFQSPAISSVMGSVPKDKLNTASAVLGTVRHLSATCGTVIAGAVLTIRQSFYAAQLARDNLGPTMLERLSLVGGFQDAILMAAIVCCISVFATLVGVKKRWNY